MRSAMHHLEVASITIQPIENEKAGDRERRRNETMKVHKIHLFTVGCVHSLELQTLRL